MPSLNIIWNSNDNPFSNCTEHDLFSNEPEENVDFEKHYYAWEEFIMFKDRIGDDHFNSFSNFSACCPDNICEACFDDIVDTYDCGLNQLGCMAKYFDNGNSIIMKLLMIKLGTWNANGFYCRDFSMFDKKRKYVCSILKMGVSVLGIQETHDNNVLNEDHLMMYLQRDYVIYASCLTNASGGISIIVLKTYASLFRTMYDEVIMVGRALALHCKNDYAHIIFISVHIHACSDEGKIGILKKIKHLVSLYPTALVFIFGDFNFIMDESDRINMEEGLLCGRMCRVAKHWERHFEEYTEIHQPAFTRTSGIGQVGGTSARLDRIYCKIPIEFNQLYATSCSTFGKLEEHELSDHISVISCMNEK